MFGIERERLIENLKKMKDRNCCYMGPTCDCKYGASGTGEQTGCPEISLVITLLKTMDEKMFKALSRKAQVVFTDDLIKAFTGKSAEKRKK